MPAKDPNFDKSGTQNDNSDDPVVNMRLPGAHFIRGGSVSVLAQHATWKHDDHKKNMSPGTKPRSNGHHKG